MNHNGKVITFTIAAIVILLALSFLFTATNTDLFSFKNVNIISDLLTEPTKVKEQKNVVAGISKIPGAKPVANFRAFDDYVLPRKIMRFGADTMQSALPHFMQQLSKIKSGKKAKLRIGWFGDSMIEGDLLTQTFRKRIQQTFGGYGVGFVPVQSITAGFRITVRHRWTGDWKEENFKNNQFTAPLYLSGHTYFTDNGTLEMTDATVPDTDKVQLLEKSLICGQTNGNVDVFVNGGAINYNPSKKLNRVVLDSSNGHHINLTIKDNKLPVYGVSFEPATGVVVDNFSFRGITGVELIKLDTDLLKSLDEQNYYDLIVVEYGANLMFRPNDKDYSWYQKKMEASLQKLHNAMPHTEFLLISTADRAFRYNGEWATAVGIDSLVKTQAQLAYNNNMAFYNMYSSMGGAGTIVNWASQKPSLANQDYVHPNHRGAEVLGNMLYDDFMKDMDKIKTTKPN